ncbi:hypothetical protein MLD38_032749 [Melastoma candidum]|uniref:Uncharacterized protein n=1 Tax=Melastoma candidum TaxID=119954 RepID=A0ACB9M4F7_9MYRT|nr:hypothetical protein MLD38_032749 [Melastoma candidum]
MASQSLGDNLGIPEDLIDAACRFSITAHGNSQEHFLLDKSWSPYALIAFPGSWSLGDWYSQKDPARMAFGESQVNLEMFPCLRSIGNYEVAKVNRAFLDRFLITKERSYLRSEVENALREGRRVIFAGHSSGGPIAIFATIWFFEEYVRLKRTQIPPFCLTFGSPLAADHIFCQAVRREGWSDHFVHFISRYDIVPRILLAPLSSVKNDAEGILPLFNPKTPLPMADLGYQQKLEMLFINVLRNASCAASHAACVMMGNTNTLLDTVTNFVELSPYRPFGNYVFCSGEGKLMVVKNPNAVLQLLFYSSQLSSEAELKDVARKSLEEHRVYEDKLKQRQNVIYLEKFQQLPLSTNNMVDSETGISAALENLGLSARARLCLRAAREWEKLKATNQLKINAKKESIENRLAALKDYRQKSKTGKMCYYDAFRAQKGESDFEANIKRLELAGLWDEVVEMLKRHELPDRFESEKEWMELATTYKRLVEPLDIANYYRHLKNEDTGPYMEKGRPRRYRYTQRWREHLEQLPRGSSGESCFWAEVEEINIDVFAKKKPYGEVMNRVLEVENNLRRWYERGEVEEDVFLEESTLVKFWKNLPDHDREQSCIREFIPS